jgi:hypothetical protein
VTLAESFGQGLPNIELVREEEVNDDDSSESVVTYFLRCRLCLAENFDESDKALHVFGACTEPI